MDKSLVGLQHRYILVFLSALFTLRLLVTVNGVCVMIQPYFVREIFPTFCTFNIVCGYMYFHHVISKSAFVLHLFATSIALNWVDRVGIVNVIVEIIFRI